MSIIEQSTDYLNRNYMRLIKKYPGEYVIVQGNRIIAHGTDLDEVDDEAIRKVGHKEEPLVLEFIPESIEDACISL